MAWVRVYGGVLEALQAHLQAAGQDEWRRPEPENLVGLTHEGGLGARSAQNC